MGIEAPARRAPAGRHGRIAALRSGCGWSANLRAGRGGRHLQLLRSIAGGEPELAGGLECAGRDESIAASAKATSADATHRCCRRRDGNGGSGSSDSAPAAATGAGTACLT